MNNEKKVEQIFAQVQAKGHKQSEVFYTSVDFKKVNTRKFRVTETKQARNEGYGIRIIEEGKVGFAFSTDFSSQAVEETIDKAAAILHYMDADETNFLPPAEENPVQRPLDTFDDQVKGVSVEALVGLAEKIEKEAYGYDKRIVNTEEIGVSCGVSESLLLSAATPLRKNTSTYISGYAEVVAEQGAAKEAGAYSQSTVYVKDFDANKVGQLAAYRSSILLDARQVPTQKMDIVLDPTVAVDFLAVLSSMFDAEQVYKGKSLLKGRLGQQVASPLLTIVDDGMYAKGLASAYYDDEGVPTQHTVVMEQGVLHSYLYDSKNARRLKAKSTGNAFRSSYKALPSISPSNIYIKPGDRPTGDYLRATDRALYVFEVMGLHMVNPISGDFSLGAQGFLIEKGEKVQSVKGVMIAGNLLDFLNKVDFVGNDLAFFSGAGYTGAPTIGIRDITVGG